MLALVKLTPAASLALSNVIHMKVGMREQDTPFAPIKTFEPCVKGVPHPQLIRDVPQVVLLAFHAIPVKKKTELILFVPEKKKGEALGSECGSICAKSQHFTTD